MKEQLHNECWCLKVGEGFLWLPLDNCQHNDWSSAHGTGLPRNINHVDQVCGVGKDPTRDCGPLCTLSLGLTVAQAHVMRCNMSGALIKRHPHIGLTSVSVQFIPHDRNLLPEYVWPVQPSCYRSLLHTGLVRGERGSLCIKWDVQ